MKKRSIIYLILVLPLLAACQKSEGEWPPSPTPTAETALTITSAIRPTPTQPPEPSPTPSELAHDGYEFPISIDPTQRYLLYLHGKILEDQDIPAISPEFGEYRYLDILQTLESHGFVVISERRPRDADGWDYAQRTANQVNELLAAGVPPGSITVVGASKGAAIAAVASHLVGNPEVSYVLLATCHPSLVEEWKQDGLILSGNVLAIYDIEDDEYAGSCAELFQLAKEQGLNRYDEQVLQVGTGHGIVYEPLPEWVLPTVQWALQDE